MFVGGFDKIAGVLGNELSKRYGEKTTVLGDTARKMMADDIKFARNLNRKQFPKGHHFDAGVAGHGFLVGNSDREILRKALKNRKSWPDKKFGMTAEVANEVRKTRYPWRLEAIIGKSGKPYNWRWSN